MSQFVLNKNHPLIPREQNFVLFRKIISIHSFDRDINKWPNANHFEIDLPEDLTKVQSIRLVQITIPNNQYVFTNSYQNTKFNFILSHGGVTGAPITITIEEGSYTAEQLAIEIATKMNKAAIAAGAPLSVPSNYNGFVCKYNSVSNTFWFGNKEDNFDLNFNENPGYIIPCGQTEVWEHYTKWGLPAYLGYDRKKYTATSTTDPSGFGFDYEFPTYWLEPSGTAYYVDISNSKCNLDLFGEDSIYMEIDRYNSMDELTPFVENTMSLYNNDYTGAVKSALAKIPVGLACNFGLFGDSKNFYLMNSSYFTPPIDRITRLRFTFRYHDGRLVDFKWIPFNFSLEFNILRDDPATNMTITVPQFFM